MNNVVMIGFKSSGKTTVGRLLASRLGMIFRDLDDTIQNLLDERYVTATYTVRSFFREHGVAAFREIESEALRRHLNDCNVVLASGGGAPMNHENAEIFKRLGTVCYVIADVRLIFDRFVADGMPAYLEDVPDDERLSRLTEIWHERNKVYEKIADLTVVSTAGPAEDVAEELDRLLHNLRKTTN